MRTNMEPLIPTTSTLSPAIAHIAETASALASSVRQRTSASNLSEPSSGGERKGGKKHLQRATVRWVLNAPKRLRETKDEETARRDWEEVRGLLERWERTEGVERVRRECLQVMEEKNEG